VIRGGEHDDGGRGAGRAQTGGRLLISSNCIFHEKESSPEGEEDAHAEVVCRMKFMVT
jgi:hypothetical protein